jgi:poly(glycerol-phosphate) alpha-glucosyltransferase
MIKTAVLTGSVSRKAGGLFHSVRRLHSEISRDDEVQVQVLSLADKHAQEDLPQWQPLAVQAMPVYGPRSFGYSPGLRTALFNGQFDLLHVHGLWQYPSCLAHSWHRKTGAPYVVSPRGMLDVWALENSRWKKKIAGYLYENAHLRNAACLHALCESEAQSFRAYGLKNPIAIIPNGIDLPEIGNRKSEIGNAPWQGLIEPGKKLLLFLGRIHPKKGLLNLLRAWADIRKSEIGNRKSNEWVLAIAGWDQGGHEAELKQLCSELQIPFADIRDPKSEIGNRKSEISPPSVLFLGPQFNEAKSGCYAHADAFILPSFSEGLPMAVLEAWANGLPVLMTPGCNLPVAFASNAAIRMEAYPEDIANRMHDFFRLAEPAQNEIGKKGFELVRKQFVWPVIGQEMVRLYQWILGGGPRPGCLIDL